MNIRCKLCVCWNWYKCLRDKNSVLRIDLNGSSVNKHFSIVKRIVHHAEGHFFIHWTETTNEAISGFYRIK